MNANLLDRDLPLACEFRRVCNRRALIKNNFHHFSIPLCADRSSTYLPISVCSTGSEEPQQGENVKLNQDMLQLLIETCDGIFFFNLCVVISNQPPPTPTFSLPPMPEPCNLEGLPTPTYPRSRVNPLHKETGRGGGGEAIDRRLHLVRHRLRCSRF